MGRMAPGRCASCGSLDFNDMHEDWCPRKRGLHRDWSGPKVVETRRSATLKAPLKPAPQVVAAAPPDRGEAAARPRRGSSGGTTDRALWIFGPKAKPDHDGPMPSIGFPSSNWFIEEK